jgi:2-amino-4-hydroxy-6-hydroxymethyldihydropteridine diphosphokinase
LNGGAGADRVRAFIGLGSNLQEPVEQLRRALQALARISGCTLETHSRLYRSRPMGPQDQPAYVNAVAQLSTVLAPPDLLDRLQALELAQGRERSAQRWGPRTLDLDILLYGDRRIELPRLRVPHPGLASREFVLYPLLEIAGPDLTVPGLGRLGELVARCARNALEPLD